MKGTWQLAIIQAFKAHWELQIEQIVIFSKQCSNISNFEYFEWEPNMRSISKCIAFTTTAALRKLSNHMLEQHKTIIKSF